MPPLCFIWGDLIWTHITSLYALAFVNLYNQGLVFKLCKHLSPTELNKYSMLPFFSLPTYLMCYWCYNICPFYLIPFFLCNVSSNQSQHGVIVGWLKCTIDLPIQLLQLLGINMKEKVNKLETKLIWTKHIC